MSRIIFTRDEILNIRDSTPSDLCPNFLASPVDLQDLLTSARISNGCVSVLRIYDRDSLVRIKESMEGLSDTRGRYKQAFPPPFIIDPDSPEYLLLCRAPGKVRRKSRKRGSRSGVQVKRRRAAARLGPAIFGHGERVRCLYRIPLLNVCDSTSTLPSAWTTMTVLESTQRWSSGQRLSSPPRSSVFTPVPARSSRSPRDRCLRPIPLRSADTASVTSLTYRPVK